MVSSQHDNNNNNNNNNNDDNDEEGVISVNTYKSLRHHGKSQSLSIQSTSTDHTTTSDAATHGTSHTVTSHVLQKNVCSPIIPRKQKSYGVPDFGEDCGDDNGCCDDDGDDLELLHCGNEDAVTMLTSIPEATEEEYETDIDFDNLHTELDPDINNNNNHNHNRFIVMSDSMDSDDDPSDINELYDSDNNNNNNNNVLPPGLKPISPPNMSLRHALHARRGSMVLYTDPNNINANNHQYETYELLNAIHDLESDDECGSFPDIAKLGRSNSYKTNQPYIPSSTKSKSVGDADDGRFAIIVSDENRKRLPLTPPKKQKKQSIILSEPPMVGIPSNGHNIPRLQTSQSNTIHVYRHHNINNHNNNYCLTINHHHNKQNQSMNFNGLPTSSTKKLAAHQHSTSEIIQTRFDLHKDVVFPSKLNNKHRGTSFSKTISQSADVYYYTYPEYNEYLSDSDDNHHINVDNGDRSKTLPLKPLTLSPKDSDEPIVELNLAKINDDNSHNNNDKNNNQFLKTVPSIHGYNSGSDDTLHYDDTPSPIFSNGTIIIPNSIRSMSRSGSNSPLNDSKNSNSKHSPYHGMPITPKQRSTYDNFEGDGNISEEDTNGITDIIRNSKRKHTAHPSKVILLGRHASSISLSNKQLHDFTDPRSLKLLNQESQCEGQGDYDDDDDDDNDNQQDQVDDDDNDNNYDNDDNSTQQTPTTTTTNNISHLNIFAYLSKIKDTDARAIWMQAQNGGNINKNNKNNCNQHAYLYKLYPYLVKKFQVTTRTKNRYPQIQQIEHYFLRMGGKYLRNTNFPVIHISKYNKFYNWFIFMCSIVSELRMIYDDYNLDCLFYGKRTSSEILKMRPQGTFILSLTNKTNVLSLKYKKTNKTHDISTVFLIRHGRDSYSVGKSKKKSSLYQIIRTRTYLKKLYTPQMLIDKKALF